MSLWSKDEREKKEFKFTSASDGKFFSPGKTKEKREKTRGIRTLYFSKEENDLQPFFLSLSLFPTPARSGQRKILKNLVLAKT